MVHREFALRLVACLALVVAPGSALAKDWSIPPFEGLIEPTGLLSISPGPEFVGDGICFKCHEDQRDAFNLSQHRRSYDELATSQTATAITDRMGLGAMRE